MRMEESVGEAKPVVEVPYASSMRLSIYALHTY